MLDTTLGASVNCLHTSLAQRTFEALYPTLVVNSAIDPEWEIGEELVSDALVLLPALPLLNDPIDLSFRPLRIDWAMTSLRFPAILLLENSSF